MKAVLFDLDNTLYAAERDLFSLIDVRINRYMEEVVSIAPEDVDRLRRRYWQEYGTTLQGLIRHHTVDAEDYLSYVHAVDVASRLDPDHQLRHALQQLPIPRYVFTNGSRCHVDRVLQALQIGDQFADVFDIRIADYLPKPHLRPYQNVLKQLALRGEQCVMVEDQPQNLLPAKQLGMKTILVGPPSVDSSAYVDARLETVNQAVPLIARWLEG